MFPHLTVLENVRIGAAAQPRHLVPFLEAAKRSLTRSTTARMELLARGRPGSVSPSELTVELPYGRKRALEIATTLAMEPELMLLDEPTQGMGHEDVDRVTALIKKVSAGPHHPDGRAQHERGVAHLPTRITVLQRGAVLAEGTYAEVSKQPAGDRGLHGQRRQPTLRGRALMAAGTARDRRTCTPGTASRTSCTASTDGDAGRGGHAAGPQRRRPHHHLARDHGPDRHGAPARSRSAASRRSSLPTHRIAHLGVGYCPEERGIFSSLSAEENLLLPPALAGTARHVASTRSTRCSPT